MVKSNRGETADGTRFPVMVVGQITGQSGSETQRNQQEAQATGQMIPLAQRGCVVTCVYSPDELQTDPPYVDREDLTPVSTGMRLEKLVESSLLASYPLVRERLERSTLYGILECSYTSIDRGTISAFVERWHPETCSFHMPFGEMTVTLDDVSCLLHLPIYGRFFTPPALTRSEVADMCVRLLGATKDEVQVEFIANRGTQLEVHLAHGALRGR
ncbi:uncharacterized protein LOC130712453 [Lotus japonicus]|uniref:uncharacterized protein LOC130712453 n=1 Tax=Lotus japonicus TaxID=34305 RepID=UPI0025872191|nr:uncharacterized protein LOC130712453 [Lotus japonicus]